jgi:hypothetical protein
MTEHEFRWQIRRQGRLVLLSQAVAVAAIMVAGYAVALARENRPAPTHLVAPR